MAKSAQDPFEQHADQIRAEFSKGRFPAKPGEFDFAEFCKRGSETVPPGVSELSMAYASLLKASSKE